VQGFQSAKLLLRYKALRNRMEKRKVSSRKAYIVFIFAAKPEVIPVKSTVTAVLGMEVTLSVIIKADPPASPDQITW
jgi:hypothetical protein